MNLKCPITSNSDTSIIAECERSEDSAVPNYEDALEKLLQSNLEAMVLRQFRELQDAHKRIRERRRQVKPVEVFPVR